MVNVTEKKLTSVLCNVAPLPCCHCDKVLVDAEAPVRRLRFNGLLLPKNNVCDLHGCAWLRMRITRNTLISDLLSVENVSPSPFCQIYCCVFFPDGLLTLQL